jgi:hypothetical protein
MSMSKKQKTLAAFLKFARVNFLAPKRDKEIGQCFTNGTAHLCLIIT